ncbi:uncharacterized protein L969DRAFT_26587 [Mixia osmundae IAM 14324]|uniref:uncharacterized protein n=1 Tax=Mixia osmundae (strain CBS 9802 / IAM 14324 / JCM 22182 / KY 12970) TaxID=764103 RepID=UPI0004A55698|nr:uncharacterized protein L969DRAFT_26587 [Mixia osmundae IAM 14324]KEI36512.1 hypothetical protein L969DRAFT_26587 [Mixia osmundae IAM 14324]
MSPLRDYEQAATSPPTVGDTFLSAGQERWEMTRTEAISATKQAQHTLAALNESVENRKYALPRAEGFIEAPLDRLFVSTPTTAFTIPAFDASPTSSSQGIHKPLLREPEEILGIKWQITQGQLERLRRLARPIRAQTLEEANGQPLSDADEYELASLFERRSERSLLTLESKARMKLTDISGLSSSPLATSPATAMGKEDMEDLVRTLHEDLGVAT